MIATTGGQTCYYAAANPTCLLIESQPQKKAALLARNKGGTR